MNNKLTIASGVFEGQTIVDSDGTLGFISSDGDIIPFTSSELERVTEAQQQQQMIDYSKEVQRVIQNHLDTLAQSKRYENMLSVRGYTGFPNEFQRECIHMAMYAGDVWKVITDLEKRVLAGESPPSIEEILNLIPRFSDDR